MSDVQEFITLGVPGLYLRGVKTSSFVANETSTPFFLIDRTLRLQVPHYKDDIYTFSMQLAAECSIPYMASV